MNSPLLLFREFEYSQYSFNASAVSVAATGRCVSLFSVPADKGRCALNGIDTIIQVHSLNKPASPSQTNSGIQVSILDYSTSGPPELSASLDKHPTSVHALDHVQRMRGGSQAHLMRCSDGFDYVVKFQNNPQHAQILANEMLGTLLAGWMGLPVAPVALVQVGQEIINTTQELVMRVGTSVMPCRSGFQFGSRYIFDPLESVGQTFLRDENLVEVENVSDFLGMLVFDKWTCNTDWRQVVFHKRKGQTRFQTTMIDQGFCFNAEKWNFPDRPFIGLFPHLLVYRTVRGIESFEKWLSVLESSVMTTRLENAALWIPTEWYANDTSGLNRLVDQLDCRRKRVRKKLEQARMYFRNPFPNWK